MKDWLVKCLAVGLLWAVAAAASTEALEATTTGGRFIFRRQAPEKEKEVTTSASPPARLYPDLPRPPEVDPFGPGSAAGQHNFPPAGFPAGPTPFLPSFAGGPNQQAGHFRPMQTIRPMPAMTAAERQQSASFTNGLGARLLAMMGIKPTERRSSETPGEFPVGELAGSGNQQQALQNATVLNQLNKGVHTIYGSLSKMYNTTVQQQLNLLQERFNRELENSTSPWQQRMAKQVPEFFKQVAARVNEAQENLNKVVRQVGQTISNTSALESFDVSGGQSRPRHFFDQFHEQFADFHPSHFFNQITGTNSDPNNQQMSLASRMRLFWQDQVQPQIGFVRGQVNRVWRDLSMNGLLAPVAGFASNRNSAGGNESSSDLVDDILKSVDVTSSDFVLFDTGNQPAESAMKAERLQQAASEQSQPNQVLNRTAQAIEQSQQIIQNGLVSAQRELNQLWSGLSSSLQATMARVRNMLRPRQFPPDQQQLPAADPAENEIDGRLKELGKLQRDADNVYETVQRQQQQQRSGFGDNFRHLFHQFNEQLEHIPSRVGDSVNRFGTAVNDLWGQIPTRWNHFMENIRPSGNQQPASSTTSKP